jgi:kynureninase
LDHWSAYGVRGHFQLEQPWATYQDQMADSMARVVGADPSEVVIMNTLTINLHLMLVSFYRPTSTRFKIVMEAHAFPSDQYAVQSHLRLHNLNPDEALIILHPRSGEPTLRPTDIETVLESEGDSIALVLLGGINYYSGQVFDMARLTERGRAHGCTVGFDLAHAAGNIPLYLHDWKVDFAVWCTYKYLNAGPGSLGGCFVHQRHAERRDLPRLAGWWGHNKQSRFLMPDQFDPIPGAQGWQLSNAPILSLAPLRASLELFDEVGMPRLRAKSIQLTGYLEYLLHLHLDDDITIITPRDPRQRGAQLSIRIDGNGKALFDHLTRHDVICDWREPNAIRVSPVPFYNSYLDVFRFVEILKAGLTPD